MPMLLKFFNPFRQNNLTTSEITKPLMQKIYKSILVLYTSPIQIGKKITVDKYAGVVRYINLWYVKLQTNKRSIFIPTSFIYDKVIETQD